jgi:hypothetical protein
LSSSAEAAKVVALPGDLSRCRVACRGGGASSARRIASARLAPEVHHWPPLPPLPLLRCGGGRSTPAAAMAGTSSSAIAAPLAAAETAAAAEP